MCGIIGWKSHNDSISNLISQNQLRGGYSVGGLDVISGNTIKCLDNEFNINKFYNQMDLNSSYILQFRAPTVDSKEYVYEENYPLLYEDCVLFGNGVISTDCFRKMKDEVNNNDLFYVLKGIVNKDWKFLEEVEGVFALVFMDVAEHIFLVRKDFPLYYSDNIISSVKFNGGELLEHGLVKGWNYDYEKKLNLEKVW